MICNLIYLFILFIFGCTYLSLFIFIAAHRVSPVVASRGSCSLQCVGFSLRWLSLLQSVGSLVVVHGLSCPIACGVFLDQGYNLHPQHWQVDCQPLEHQGSPDLYFFFFMWWSSSSFIIFIVRYLVFLCNYRFCLFKFYLLLVVTAI